MSDVIFVDGLFFEKPGEKAPDFVKGKLAINAEKLVPWIAKHKNEKGWVNIDLKKSKEGNLYLSLNTYKKAEPKAEEAPEVIPNSTENINPDDIPF